MASSSEMRNVAALDDAELVEACRSGSLDAFGWLVEKYQNLALALALSHVQNFHDAQEIVQEAFLNAYCKLVQLNDPKRFKSWLYTIIINLCRSWLRRRSDIFSPLDASIQMTISHLSIQRERQEKLRSSIWESVEALPEKYRTVLLLYYMNDYSYSEIAEFINLPVTTVKGRLQQARLKLKRELEPEEKEELRMSRVNSEFSRRVKLAACQIATEPIKEIIQFVDTDHLVLFFGVSADVEVRQHDKEIAEITGAKYSLAGEEEDARRSVSMIQSYIDTTEDYWEDGPHHVEIFAETRTAPDGKTPVAAFTSAGDSWRSIQNRLMEERGQVSSILRGALGKATRVTIGREKGEDILLSDEAYTEEVQRIFTVRFGDKGQLFGPPGYVNLVISLPPGKGLTVVGGKVRVSDVRGDVHLVHCGDAAVDGLEGTMCLYETHLAQARDIKGRLIQHFHQFGGSSWSKPYSSRRVPDYETKLQKIVGETHIDVGNVLIEASEMECKTLIKNRFGTTRFYQAGKLANGDCEIQSSSGDVLVFLGEKCIGETNFAAKTVCGEIHYSGLKDLSPPHKGNTPYEMWVKTVREFATADMRFQTESGDIRIEKMVLDTSDF